MQITSTIPAASAANVLVTTNIQIVFDANVDPASVDESSVVVSAKKVDVVSFKNNQVQPSIFGNDNFLDGEFTGITTGKITVSGNTITFTPKTILAPETSYTITVSGAISDALGNTLGKIKTFSFKTMEKDLAMDSLPVPVTSQIIGTNIYLNEENNSQTSFKVLSSFPHSNSFLVKNNAVEIKFNTAPKDNQGSLIEVFTQGLVSDEQPDKVAANLYDVTVSGNKLVVTLDQSVLADNLFIQITVDPTFKDSSDTPLGKEFSVVFATKLEPYYSSTKLLRLKAGTMLTKLSDIQLALSVWYASYEVDEILKMHEITDVKKNMLRAKYALHMSIGSLLLNNFQFGLHDFVKKHLSEFDISVSNKTQIGLYNQLIRASQHFKRSFDSYLNFYGDKGIFVLGSKVRQTSIGKQWVGGRPGLNTKFDIGDRLVLGWDDEYAAWDE
jgi:hypothetical protein